jgi:hypothetical protein
MWDSVGSLRCRFALLFGFPSPDSVFQQLEESNTLLKLVRDIVTQGKGILDLVVQVPHDSSTFCRVVSSNVGGMALKSCKIGGVVAISLLQQLLFSFSCY